jgi:hypothetical protein
MVMDTGGPFGVEGFVSWSAFNLVGMAGGVVAPSE